ncbi:MAG: hypothetical protein JJ952_18545 [Pseudomonadales bacterium]|nr:hypothetical protein [Pseudomonadales bacterium]MBO6824252.1 hypothetical protein [Pseudomonadales bacterium]
MRGLLTILAVLICISLIAWFQKIPIATAILASRFDLQIELDSIDISPGRLLSIRGTNLQISGAHFSAEAKKVYVELRLEQLLGDEYFLAYVEAIDGRVEIAEDLTEAKSEQEQNQGENLALQRSIRWVPESFTLRNVDMRYLDEDQDIQATLWQCGSQKRAEANEIDIDCRGVLQGTPLNIHGRYGLPDPLGNTEPLDLNVNWGQYSLNAEGKLDAFSRLQGVDLNLSLTAPDSTPLLKLLGASEVRRGIVDLQGSVAHETDRFSVNLSGELSGIAVSVNGALGDLSSHSIIDANFSIAGPSLFEVGALFNEFRLQPQPFSTTGHIKFGHDHLTLSDIRVAVEQGLMTANVEVPNFPNTEGLLLDVKANQFKPKILRSVAEQCDLTHEAVDVAVGVNINELGQTVDINIEASSYEISANGVLNEEPGSVRMDVDIAGTSLELIGQCLNLGLPNVRATLSTSLHFSDNTLAFSDAHLNSELVGISGTGLVHLDEELAYSADLRIEIPDALALNDAIGRYRTPLSNFPFEGELNLAGSRKSVDVTRFTFNAAGQEGSLSGTLGNPSTLEGLRLKIAMRGENLRHLISDAESSSNHAQPYQLETQINQDTNGWMIETLDLKLANTTIKLEGRLSQQPMFLGSHLDVEAKGENIQNLVGPWVDHPLPELPFEVNTRINFTNDFFRFEDIYATVGGHVLKANINVDRPPDYSNSFGRLTLHGPSTTDLLDLLDIEFNLLDRPYEFSFNLKGDLDRLVINELESQIAETDISGQIVFQNKTPYYLDIDLRSDSLFLPLFDPSLLGETKRETTEEADNRSVFSDATLPTSWMHALEGEFTWDIQNAWTSEAYTTGILFDLALEDAELKGRDIQWDSDDSKGDLKFHMKEKQGIIDIHLDATSSRLPLVWLLAGESLPSKSTGFSALLHSEGNSLQSMMANLDGTVLWQGGSGRIQSNRLEFLFGDFLTAATNVIIGRQSAADRGTTRVSCTAGAIHFDKGIATLNPGIVSRTDRTDFFASGSIDLGLEELDLVFLTRSRTGMGISPLKVVAPRLKVGGTMTDVSFSIDTASSALSAGAAFFSGGVSVLATGLWDRVNASADACSQLKLQAEGMPEFSAHITE